jgi:hypothetical protein
MVAWQLPKLINKSHYAKKNQWFFFNISFEIVLGFAKYKRETANSADGNCTQKSRVQLIKDSYK